MKVNAAEGFTAETGFTCTYGKKPCGCHRGRGGVLYRCAYVCVFGGGALAAALFLSLHPTGIAFAAMKGVFAMSKTIVFSGSATALVTPFTDSGVNFDTLGQLIDFQLDGGTEALVICGTTGEASTMTPRERADAIAFAKQRVNGKIPIIAGTGANNTASAIRHSIEAQEAGADALLVVTPYYNKTSQHGLVKYYTDIADAVDLPVIAYNVPSRTSLNIRPETMELIARHPRVVGIKEASADITQIAQLARRCPDLAIYSGCDDHVLAIMAFGGRGVISTVANIAPKQMHDVCAAFLCGDVAKSRELQLALNPLADAMFCDVNPVPVKTALRLMGYDVGALRAPLCDLLPQVQAHMEQVMRNYGLIG